MLSAEKFTEADKQIRGSSPGIERNDVAAEKLLEAARGQQRDDAMETMCAVDGAVSEAARHRSACVRAAVHTLAAMPRRRVKRRARSVVAWWRLQAMRASAQMRTEVQALEAWEWREMEYEIWAARFADQIEGRAGVRPPGRRGEGHRAERSGRGSQYQYTGTVPGVVS